MRLEDTELRNAARRGEPRSCLEIARRLFSGTNGFAQNFRLGLAYLQQELIKGAPSPTMLVGEKVPLEILMAQGCRTTLEEAAHLASPVARLKLGIWMTLRRAEREEGTRWIELSGHSGYRLTSDPSAFSRFLTAITNLAFGNTYEVLLFGAHDALKRADVQDACYCIRVAAELTPSARLAEVVSLTVQLAAKTDANLDLPVALVEASLSTECERSEVEAQYALGCTLGGLPYGLLMPQQLAIRANARAAAALLLRAADAGKHEAWLTLSDMAPDYTGQSANRHMSRFFLEKAAHSGVLQAQTKLGAVLLKEATCVGKAEEGAQWLSQAADRGNLDAMELLRTLVLPLPQLSQEYQQSVIEQVRTVSPELGARLALARALHLTRHEALTVNAKANIRPWGLVMRGTARENPKGRIAPAITPHMKSELERAASLLDAASSTENALSPQKSRTQRQLFRALSISETQFFAEEIGRSRTHYGFGRHWAARAAPLLRALLA